MPRSGRERDGFTSTISPRSVSASPAYTGCVHDQLAASTNVATGKSRMPPVTSSRMPSDAVCQPLAARPLKKLAVRRRLIQMKGLRIELRRERLDLFGSDRSPDHS